MKKSFKFIHVYVILAVITLFMYGCSSNDVSVQTQSKNDAKQETSVSDDQLLVHFIDVGQGDSILIQSEKDAMLIDAGENDKGTNVVNYLQQQGVSKLKYVIGTHPHSDHIGGLDEVIGDVAVDKVFLPDCSNNSDTFQDVLDLISNKGLGVIKAAAGKEYSLGDATFTILAPNGKEYNDLNNYSVVIKLVYKDTSFILTGDAEELSEKEMINKGFDLSADVLKLGHHGSSYSSCDEFLDAVHPSYAVISVGTQNKYGHPATETVNKILKRRIKLYRTDEDGTIVATSDGKKITFNQKTSSTDTNTKTTTVYVTKSGTKYHKDGCTSLTGSKIAISLDEAKKTYEPCKKCFP